MNEFNENEYEPYAPPQEQPESTAAQEQEQAQEQSQAQAQEQPRNFYEYQPQPAAPEKKPPKKKGAARLVALALCCSLLGGILGAGIVVLLQGSGSGSVTSSGNTSVLLEGLRENSVIETVQVDTSEEMTAAEVYAANVQSTVGITTSITTNYFGYQTTSAASGSGFIITTDGYILTNYHVIEDSDSITVTMYGGESYDAALIGYDESNDIAVLKIEAGEELTPVILGDSDNLNVGDSVVAIGNPLGELTFTLTVGVVSAKDRQVTLSTNVTMNLIQTDAAINSGNSGGALFNMYGEVIGITNAKYSSSSSSEASIDNIGFAIPINSVRDIVESIIEKGYISKPYIGVTVMDVSSEAQLYGLPQGAAVQSVTEDAPADKAGLQVNDIITKAGDTEITGSSDLVSVVSGLSVGDELVVTVYRQGETLELTIVIEEQIQSALANEETEESSSNSSSSSGSYPGGSGSRPW